MSFLRGQLFISVMLIISRAAGETCQFPEQSTAQGYLDVGTSYAQREEHACAIRAYRSALKLAPDSWEAKQGLGIALLGSGEPEHAVEELQLVVHLRPGAVAAQAALGVALKELGDLNGAVEALQFALKLKPDFTVASYNLAEVLSKQGRHSAAIAYRERRSSFDVRMNSSIEYGCCWPWHTGRLSNTRRLWLF